MNEGMPLSAADVAAVTRNNDGDGFGGGGWGAWWIILIVLFAFGGWGRGFGGFGGGSGLEGIATRADINSGFALNGLENGIRGIQQGLCDGFYAMNTSMLNGFNSVGTQISNLGFQLQNCCCETQRAIDGVNYNMAKNTCDLQNTMNNNTRDIIDSQNAGTRAILDYLCQDKIQTLQAENQSLKLAASQSNQNSYLTATMDANTAELIRRINPTPVPAYTVPAPYPYAGCGCNYNPCGC